MATRALIVLPDDSSKAIVDAIAGGLRILDDVGVRGGAELLVLDDKG
jgi:hypothetical protein